MHPFVKTHEPSPFVFEHTSQASYDKYVDSLLADGWALSGARGATDNTLTKGSSEIGLVLKVHEGNTWISIDLKY